jgi:hypothetical protein
MSKRKKREKREKDDFIVDDMTIDERSRFRGPLTKNEMLDICLEYMIKKYDTLPCTGGLEKPFFSKPSDINIYIAGIEYDEDGRSFCASMARACEYMNWRERNVLHRKFRPSDAEHIMYRKDGNGPALAGDAAMTIIENAMMWEYINLKKRTIKDRRDEVLMASLIRKQARV